MSKDYDKSEMITCKDCGETKPRISSDGTRNYIWTENPETCLVCQQKKRQARKKQEEKEKEALCLRIEALEQQVAEMQDPIPFYRNALKRKENKQQGEKAEKIKVTLYLDATVEMAVKVMAETQGKEIRLKSSDVVNDIIQRYYNNQVDDDTKKTVEKMLKLKNSAS